MNMEIYYEVPCKDGGVQCFHSLDAAIEYADKNECTKISEVGGSWVEYGKCWFCGEWFDICELNAGDECSRCEAAIRDHFGYQERR